MQRLTVGSPLQPGPTAFEEGAHYNYTPGGHMLALSRKNPGPSEIDDVQRARSTFSLTTADERFHQALGYRTPYKLYAGAPANVPGPDPNSAVSRCTLPP